MPSCGKPRGPVKSATLPTNESERLAALARYNILDTAPEKAFDDLTRFAAQVCDTSVAMIALVDKDRQWFKSHHGWEVTETPRPIALCAHTILGDDMLEIHDLLADDRFADNPLVCDGPRIRAYAGVPLRANDGLNVGALSVMHHQPHSLTPDQKDSLRILARQVMSQMELRLRAEELARMVEEHQQTEARLRDSESFYQALVESLPQHILRKDTHGRFTFANRKFCDSIGRSLGELLGRTDFELYPSKLASKYHRDDLRVMATQENLDTIEAHQTPHGEKMFVHLIKTPLFDANGAVVGIQGIFWDVTQRRRIEEALAYERDLLRSLLDNIPDRIYFKDVQSRFLRCSTSMAHRLGLKNAVEAEGKTDFDFYPRDLAEEFYRDEQRIILTGKPLINKLEKLIDPQGEESWASATKVPIYNQAFSVTGIIGISRDVTQLKRTEEELEKARDTALESVRAKSQFLANMSHEIRTPMNAITGMTGLLRRTELTAEQQDYVETIGDSTTTLMAIITEILDFSKIEAGKIELESIDFDVREAVESTAKMLADHAQSKGLELTCWIERSVPPRLRGDPGRFRQILANLISNAVKFTEHGEVLVRLSRQDTPEGKALIHVAVHDTGIGIDPSAVDLIFEAFTQADGSTTRKFGGTGLGLTISRHLVELMGGRIGVESHPGQGSCFWMDLPFDRELPSLSMPEALEIPRHLPGKRVLVVDDSSTNRQILLDLLGRWEVEGTEAESHAIALARVREAAQAGNPYNLVLLDFTMPDGNGLNLASAVRSEGPNRECRVVVMTAYRDQVTLSEMQTAGISGRLIKPVRQTRLLDCLHRLFQPGHAEVFDVTDEDQSHATPLASPTSRVRILLAEDNPVNQRVAVSQLKKLGYAADSVTDGTKVLDAMKHKAYDIILMDCQMPEMDGYEASRQIRQAERLPDSPFLRSPYIIALTANTMEGDRERCLESGMNDYLSKPIDINDLSQVLHKAVTRLGHDDSRKEEDPLDHAILDSLRALPSEEDPDPLGSLIRLYLDDSDPRLERMQEAIDQHDLPALARAAHALKGSSNNLGARQLGQICGEFEKLAKAGQLEEALAVWPRLSDAYTRVKRALEREL